MADNNPNPTQPPEDPANSEAISPSQSTTATLSEYTPSERFVAAVGYISFLCLLPLILRRDSEYCQFHGKQGLFVCIFFFALRFLFILPIIGMVFMVLEVISIIIMAYLAWSGSLFRLPLIASWADRLALTREEEQTLQSQDMQDQQDLSQNQEQIQEMQNQQETTQTQPPQPTDQTPTPPTNQQPPLPPQN